MKNFKKVLVLMLTVAMIVSVFAGCKGKAKSGEQTSSGAQSSSVSYPKEVSIWTWLSGQETWGAKTLDEVQCFQELAKKTGTKVDWTIPTGDSSEAFNLMMTSGNTTDCVFYAWNTARCNQYYAAGRIKDIAPLVAKYAPNLKKIIDSNPTIKKQLYDPQGRMYFMPWLTPDTQYPMGEGMMMRKDWLDKFGLSVPTTTDELYNALKTFKDQDANGNGKQDEVGLTGYPSQVYKLFWGFGVNDGYFLQDGKVVYGPVTQQYKEALKWFNKLYTEGLLDKDYLAQDDTIYQKKMVNGLAAGMIDNYGVFSNYMQAAKDSNTPISLVGVSPLKYNGVSMNLSSATKRRAQPYGLAIGATCKDPEAVIKYLDYGFSDEGQKLFNWGVEGDTYTTKDGQPAYTDKVLKDPKYPATTAVSKYCLPSWVTVTDAKANLALMDQLGVDTTKAWQGDFTNAMEPILWLSDADATNLKKYTTDLNTFEAEWRDKFITGQENIDAKFDSFVDSLNKMGLDKATAIEQNAYDQYKNR